MCIFNPTNAVVEVEAHSCLFLIISEIYSGHSYHMWYLFFILLLSLFIYLFS
jgi:hypothetical protein